jgi:hypothetical protein
MAPLPQKATARTVLAATRKFGTSLLFLRRRVSGRERGVADVRQSVLQPSARGMATAKPEQECVRTAEENFHAAISISNASRIMTSGYPRSAIFVTDAIASIPVKHTQDVDDRPAAGQRTPRRGYPELMSLKQNIFFISG